MRSRFDTHVPATRQLLTDDGIRIDAVHLPRRRSTPAGERSYPDGVGRGSTRYPDDADDLAIVLAHGFSGSWRRPAVRRIAAALTRAGGVVGIDFRGHGRSGGLSTVGDREVLDIDAAVAYARELGYRRVAAVGFSMGASVVVRYAGIVGGLAATVSVSGPSRWYFRGTAPMRRLHWAVTRPTGRMVSRLVLRTRIARGPWDPVPESPAEVAGRISPVPLLIVHGDQDAYFPVDHAHELYEAARDPKELWIVPGFGHAEAAADPPLVRRIGDWIAGAAQPRPAPDGRAGRVAGGDPVDRG